MEIKMRTRKQIIYMFLLICLLIGKVYAQQSIDQTVITKQTNYLNSQSKKNRDLPSFSAQITTITAGQYESQKPSDALTFDCGYLDNDGKVFVSEPTTLAQKKIFANITEAAVYYLNLSYLKDFYQTSQIPLWFKVGFAAFEADLKIDDNMIRDAITKYGGSIPSYSNLNSKTLFDANNGIAISYLWGELMNVTYGWRKYTAIESFTADSYVMPSSEKSADELLKLWRRYSKVRLLEPIEKLRLKYQGESDHFKFYYRDNESFCMPYMKDALEEAYLQYSTELKIEAPKKLTYGFMPECEGAAKIDSMPCPGRYTGGSGWASGLGTSCAEKVEDLPLFKSLVRHELAHVFQMLIQPYYMPAWLSEGFASFIPDGIMSEQTVRNESGFALHKIESAKQTIGHYPTITELEDYDFLGKNGIDYYLFGLLMDDFIARKGGYGVFKNIIKSYGQDLSSIGYSSKQEFETGFYNYYNQTWMPKPKQLSIKKTYGKPRIDGKTDEAVWEKNIVLDRKLWMGGPVTGVPTIDNTVNASMLWDEENLYIAMDVKDASISKIEWVNFLDDGIEVDVDPDLSRGIDFKDNDMAFIWNVDSNGPWYRTNLNGATLVSSKTEQGYSVEISIPWNQLGITPTAGMKFGLELANFDRDNGEYQGAYVFSGHSWEGGVVLNGLAEVTLLSELAKKSCQVTSPNGGEVFVAGESETIEFRAFNVSNVKIEFSTNNGSTWSTIAANASTTTNNFNWVLPTTTTDYGKIRITDLSDNAISSVSETTFRIVNPASSFGPYLKDNNTILLMHFNNNLQNKSASGNGIGSNVSYQESAESNLCPSIKPQSIISIPHNNLLNLTGDWTIEAWVKVNSYNPNGNTLITKPGDNDAYFANYTLEINPWWGNIFYGFYFDQGNNRIGLTGIKPELNKWYHIAFIRDTQSKQIKLLLHDANKKLVSSLSIPYTNATVLTSSKDLLIASGLDANIDELRISNVIRDFTVGVEDKKEELPTQFLLSQNYPNPFNPSTVINYQLPAASYVSLKIYDMLGREVVTLVNEYQQAGSYNSNFLINNYQLSSGTYFYTVKAGDFVQTKKMVLMK
jgi:hypothetical protein